MFIARYIYDMLNERAIKAEAIRDSLTLQNAALNAHMDWMRIRLTQLEFERAGLIQKYMGVSVPVPSFDKPEEHPDPNQTMDFSDVGDEEAKRLGISWNPDGTLSYAKA